MTDDRLRHGCTATLAKIRQVVQKDQQNRHRRAHGIAVAAWHMRRSRRDACPSGHPKSKKPKRQSAKAPKEGAARPPTAAQKPKNQKSKIKKPKKQKSKEQIRYANIYESTTLDACYQCRLA
jgi:hypothetical protein